MRARLLAPLAALALLAGACGTVPGDAVATVNGTSVDYDRFERIVSAQADDLGLDARDARTAQAAIEAGVIDRAALDEALLADLQSSDPSITTGPPLEIADGFVDRVYDEVVDTDALGDIGVGERRLREVFERLVTFEIRGLQLNQGQTGFPIDRTGQLASLQQSVIQQLVQAEIARQAVDELGLEVDDEAIDQIEQQFNDRFPDQDTLLAALEDAGYTEDDFDELFVLTQARQQAIQRVEDPAAAQEFFDSLDVDVADRFGDWDLQQGQVTAPSDPV